jgi:rhodanese-related sulfurtransferase
MVGPPLIFWQAGRFVSLSTARCSSVQRGPKLCERSHVPGAINLLHGKMTATKLQESPADTLFVVYCAAPHCNGTDKTALRLGKLSRKVKIGGMTGWSDEGFSFASGALPAAFSTPRNRCTRIVHPGHGQVGSE